MRWGPVLAVSFVIMFSFSILPFNAVSDAPAPFAKVNHSPISITGNSNLQSLASSEGWPGSGTMGDPYYISNYRITATGSHCISLRNVDLYLVISGNNLTGSTFACIGLYNSENIRVTDNTIAMNDGDGVRLEDSRSIRVDNNTLDMELVLVMNYNGIHLVRSDENYVESNRIDLSENDAIRIEDGSNYNLISHNIIIENRNNGINLESDHNTVFKNHIVSNKVGVMVDASDCLILENKLKLNSYGVHLHSQGNNIVRNNNFERNSFGVKIYISDDNKIYSNYIMKSDLFGIDLEHRSASGNRIYDNSLFYNNNTLGYYIQSMRQARDNSGDNTWNDDQNRGNYWYDFRSPDNNGDGIVDDRYFLEGGEDWDLYPLVDSEIPDVFIPPKKLTAQPGMDHINLSWQGVNYGKGVRVDHFNIYKNEREGGEFFLAKVPSNELSYTDRDVVQGRSYYYYVTAVTPIAESNRSNRVKSSPDVRPPSISIKSPGDGSVLSMVDVHVDWIGNDNIAIDRYEVSLDGGDPFNVGLNEFYLFRDLSEGEHTVEVRIFDMAEHNRSDTIGFIVDTKPPELVFHNADQAPLLFNTDQPTISWTGTDEGPGIKEYQISTDGENWTLLGNVEQYTFVQPLSEGHYNITLTCYDLADNHVNGSLDIIVDLTEPSLYFLQPLGPGFYGEDRIDIRYNGSDELTDVVEYLVRIDTGEWVSKGLERTHSFRYMGEGKHYLYVKALDGAGNEVIVSQTATIDLTPPELEVYNIVEGEVYTGPVFLEWNTWDPISGVELSRLSVDGGDWRNYPDPVSVEIGFPEDGEHHLILEVIDRAGNSRSVNISFSFDVSQPMVTLAEPRGNDVPINSTIVISFSEPMQISSIVIDAPEIAGEIDWQNGNITLTPSSLLEYSKKYSIAVRGKDLAGNDLISFNWFFITVEDLSLKYGRVHGRVVTTDGIPIPSAGFRFKTGEKGTCDENGYFDIYVTTGENFIIVSNNSFMDTKIDFEVYEGEEEDLGSIPLKSQKEAVEEEKDDSSTLYVIIGIVAFILIAATVGLVVALQVKKTRDYNKMQPVVDEWVNVTQLKRSDAPPQGTDGAASRTPSEEGFQG